MAIRFIRNWHTIIINVERANKKIEGGLIALLSDYYPPKEKTMLEKIKSMFSSAKPLTLSDFDDMHFSSGTRVFADRLRTSGTGKGSYQRARGFLPRCQG